MSSVDVVVPCYNYARYLRACVESVLTQRDVDVRVLIIDDKSSDNTSEIAQALAASDPRVTFRRHEINKGLIGTANEGIDWIKAPYWLLLSADDALTPGALARATIALDAHPEIGMVYGRAQILRGGDALHELDDPLKPTIELIPRMKFVRHLFENGNTVPSPTAVVRVDLQRRIGKYEPALQHTSDLEMWSRVAMHADVCFILESQAYYRQHNSNMTLNYIGGALADRRELLSTYRYISELWSPTVPELAKLFSVSNEKFGREALSQAYQAFEQQNHQAFDDCMAFAKECLPNYRRTKAWRRLSLLLRLGPRLSRTLRNFKKNLFACCSSFARAEKTSVETWGSCPNTGPYE